MTHRDSARFVKVESPSRLAADAALRKYEDSIKRGGLRLVQDRSNTQVIDGERVSRATIEAHMQANGMLGRVVSTGPNMFVEQPMCEAITCRRPRRANDILKVGLEA